MRAVPLGRYQDLLWTVDVELAGETAPFLFDTGAGLTCVVEDLIYDGNLGATYIGNRVLTLDLRRPALWAAFCAPETVE